MALTVLLPVFPLVEGSDCSAARHGCKRWRPWLPGWACTARIAPHSQCLVLCTRPPTLGRTPAGHVVHLHDADIACTLCMGIGRQGGAVRSQATTARASCVDRGLNSALGRSS